MVAHSGHDLDDLEMGTRDFPYKLAIIGGGPSGCSVIVRAARTGTLDLLCKADEKLQLAGVCLIDKCSAERFGGGRLQDYAINSNTFANKFASNVLDEKIDTLPPESCEGTHFEKLSLTESCRQLEVYGSQSGALKVVGNFLCDVGKSVLETLNDYPTTSSYLLNTTVDSVERYHRQDGLIGWKLTITTSTSSSTSSIDGTNDDNSNNDIENKYERKYVYAKDVMFATGGKQEPPTLANTYHNNKIIGR